MEEGQAMPVAIVGMGCRLPGDATSPSKLWEMLMRKECASTDTPSDRFNVDAFYHPDGSRGGSMNNRGGHFIKEDISAFDAPFFSISPAEAISMDPMQRLLLEVVYESIENAGIPITQLTGSNTGCFVGCFTGDYDEIAKRDSETLPKYNITGGGKSIISNRVNFVFDFKGPSFTLDTACSSSLVALHLACQSLKLGECKTAIVGATNILAHPDIMISMTNLGLLSPDSISYAFDTRANGYARGEGIASILLKPLADALRDGDTIRGVIRGTAINSNGKGSGITLPSREAQMRLIKTAYEQAGCDYSKTAYVEAHGTGTQAGDPIEANALITVLADGRKPEEPLIMGSVKPNIGHLEGASGLAGLIKAVLALETGVIAPNIYFEKGNPKINWNSNIVVPVEATPWPVPGLRRVSVNGFGYGGANGHVIIDDAYHYLQERGLDGNHRTIVPNVSRPLLAQKPAESRQARCFALTARDTASLTGWSKQLAEHVRSLKFASPAEEEQFLEDLSFTLCDRRSLFEHRSVLVAAGLEELLEKLEGPLSPVRCIDGASKIAFVFTGQGAQWWAMGRELVNHPTFRKSLDACSAAVQALDSPWNLIEELLKDKKSSRINEATISQPLCTALQVCLIDLLATWGIRATKVVGHSSGEIAAAYTAGMLTLEEAMKVAYFRGLLAPEIKNHGYKGGMLAAGLSEAEALQEIAEAGDSLGKAVVACVNSPRSVTLSGDVAALGELQSRLTTKGKFARRLLVDTAYHSHHMQAIAGKYRDALGQLSKTSNPEVSMFSSVTGRRVTADDHLNADYWVDNMVSCVRFSDALTLLVNTSKEEDGDSESPLQLVELGPHSALAGPVKQTLAAIPSGPGAAPIKYHTALRRDTDATRCVVEMAAGLVEVGCRVRLNADSSAKTVLTDLPAYSWDHRRTYWSESRLSRDYKFRKFPRTDLLGAPVSDWNPLEPRWRGFVRLSEQPWVASHVVNGAILYPAAGFCSMALQAMEQLVKTATPDAKIAEYRVRDFSIARALVVPKDDAGVEVVLHMRPKTFGSLSSSELWKEFRVFSYTDSSNTWVEHCRGYIAAWKDNSSAILDSACQQRVVEARNSEWTALDAEPFYKGLDVAGLSYGPEFQSVTGVLARDANEVIGHIQVTDTRSGMPKQYESERIIHPTTLDSLLQLGISALVKGKTLDLESAYVPTFIQEMAIAGDLKANTGNKYAVLATGEKHGLRDILSDVTCVDDKTNQPVIHIDGLKCRSMAGGQLPTNESDENVLYQHVGRVFWQPDVELLSQPQLNKLLRAPLKDSKRTARTKDLELVAYYFMQKAVQTIDESEVPSMSKDNQRFFAYMKQQVELVKSGKHEQQTPEWSDIEKPELAAKIQALLKTLSDAKDPEGRMVVKMGEALPKSLRGETDPLGLMMEDDLLYDYYTSGLGVKETYPQVAEYINLLSNNNPALEYLEIGAGTGGCTAPVLEALGRCNVHKYRRLKSYTFTDISPAFFESAAKKLSGGWEEIVQFKKLDIEQDPEGQGFGQYDVVIASNVLYATKNINQTLAHVRKLLRPGGKLVLLDMTHQLLNMSLVFGNLSGWWLSTEAWREHSPLLTVDQWRKAFADNGFSDLEASTPDFETASDESTRVMVASAVEAPKEAAKDNKTIVLVPDNFSASEESYASKLVAGLKEKIQTLGSVEICGLKDLDETDLAGTTVVSFIELQNAFLKDISKTDLERLQRLANSSSGLYWITKGAWTTRPELSLMHGLARTLRSENEATCYITFDLSDTTTLDVQDAASLLFKVFKRGFIESPQQGDKEFYEQDGMVHVKRLVEDDPRNEFVAQRTRGIQPEPRLQSVWEERRDRNLELQVKKIGDFSSLTFNDISLDALADDEVEIEVMAVGLNSRDILVASGEISDDYLGNECAGVVKKIGSNVTNLKVGDRVAAWALGSFATAVRCPASYAATIPEGMAFAEAAALPLTYVTAYYSLAQVANLTQGESVLIHAGAGGVGQAAIQVATMLGAEVYVTAGSEEKRAHIAQTYGLDSGRIFSSRDLGFVKAIKKATKGQGIDVVLNSLTGEAMHATWTDVLAPFGRFLDLSQRDADKDTRLDMASQSKNVVFAAIDVTQLWKSRPKVAGNIFARVMEHVRSGKFTTAKPVTREPFSKIQDAFRLVQSGKHIGKVVLELREDDLAMVVPRPLKPTQFSADASYLLAGGLGGIGRSISKWMADHGARNIIFVSRGGASSPEARQAIEDLEKSGVRAEVIRCDISNEESLSKALQPALASMPPLRGVIQGAMVLRDGLFASMGHDSYTTSINPKVHGSWALHAATIDAPLDFFVMLSSSAAFIGNAGQSNYVAGCTFQTALAKYRRRHLGLPATAFDIGRVAGVGVVAENAGGVIEANLKRLRMPGINEAEVLAMLELAIEAGAAGGVGPEGADDEHLVAGVTDLIKPAAGEEAELPFWSRDTVFSHMSYVRPQPAQQGEGEDGANDAKNAVTPLKDVVAGQGELDDENLMAKVLAALTQRFAKALMLAASEIDSSKSPGDLGADSLVGVDLRNFLAREAGVDVPVFDILGAPSLVSMAKIVSKAIRAKKAAK